MILNEKRLKTTLNKVVFYFGTRRSGKKNYLIIK